MICQPCGFITIHQDPSQKVETVVLNGCLQEVKRLILKIQAPWGVAPSRYASGTMILENTGPFTQ